MNKDSSVECKDSPLALPPCRPAWQSPFPETTGEGLPSRQTRTVMHSVQNLTVRLTPWLGTVQNSGFAILDQGLFAGTNFLVNMLLARWLNPAEYGVFALVYSLFLLVGAFHTAVLTEPMMFLGAGKYADRFQIYFSVLLSSHWRLSGLIVVILTCLTIGLQPWVSPNLSLPLIGAIIAAPLILYLWLTRWAFYVREQPHWAATGGALYFVVTLGSLYILAYYSWLSPVNVLVVMGIASVMVGVWLCYLLQPHRPTLETNPTRAMVFADHWQYGKWAIATTALMWISNDIYYTLVPIQMGLADTGALRAVMNLLMPILQLHGAIASLFVPLFVRSLKAEGRTGLQHRVRLSLLFFFVTALLYWGVLSLCGRDMMHWLYAGRYDEYFSMLFFASLLLFPSGFGTVLLCALRAMGRPDQVFWGYTMGAVGMLTIGLWLMIHHGLLGTLMCMTVVAIVRAATLAWFYIGNCAPTTDPDDLASLRSSLTKEASK